MSEEVKKSFPTGDSGTDMMTVMVATEVNVEHGAGTVETEMTKLSNPGSVWVRVLLIPPPLNVPDLT